MSAEEQGRPRPRRFSLPLTFSPSARRRSHRISQPPLPPPTNADDKALPPIPFASPPYMPMYKPPSAATPARLVKKPPSPRPGAAQEEDLWTSSAPVVSTRTSASSSPKLGHSRVLSGEPSRFMRRLNRWTSSQRELDFGCAGEWSDGPADMGDCFYSAYPGGANRASTSSAGDELPPLTHSRGASTSSSLSVSTAPSSVPTSPVLGCRTEEIPAPLSPYCSRVPLTPRTAQRKRQTDENAAVDALNAYFTRVRLSQIKEAASERVSVSGSGGRNSLSVKSTGASSCDSTTPVSSPPAGLAIFGDDSECEISFDDGSLHPPRQKTLHHSRSISRDLEIEFIETGHTTYTPLHVSDDEACDFPSTFILPDDAFVFPTSSAMQPQLSIDTSPSALSTFAPTESTDSCETMTTLAAGSETTGESNETSSSTIFRHRSPIPEHAFDSTLDELSHYFGATSGGSSTASSCSSSSAYSSTPPPTVRHQYHASLPSLLPPVPISPLRIHRARFGSQPNTPQLGGTLGAGGAFQFPSRHVKRQSASFAAAQRAKLVQAGQASPPPSRVMYDWI
ncbi:hypothetical protein JCM11251_007899 [Rhodosporidiobolus azoricus]